MLTKKYIHVYNSTFWNGVESISGGNAHAHTHTHVWERKCIFVFWLIRETSCVWICVIEGGGGGVAGGSLERSAKKAEYSGVGKVEAVQQEWKGFDLDGGYHNRLFYYSPPPPRLVSAPCFSSGLGWGFQRTARPDDFIAIWYLTSPSHCFTTMQRIPILLTFPLFHSAQSPWRGRARMHADRADCGRKWCKRPPTTTILPRAGRHG